VPGLFEEACELLPEVRELRRAIHREPELGLELPLTQQKVLSSLEGLPLTVRRGQGTTWVMADLRGKLDEPGHTIILRADMDALPLQEDTDLPFRSRNAGRMHA
jgi:hippurate hydrolase